MDQDVCRDEDITVRACGDDGTQQRICNNGQWGEFDACEEVNFCILNPGRCVRCLDDFDPNETPETATTIESDNIGPFESNLDNLQLCDDADPIDYFRVPAAGWPTITTISAWRANRGGLISFEGLPFTRAEQPDSITSVVINNGQELVEFAIRVDETDQPAQYSLFTEAYALAVCGYTNNPNCLPCQDSLEPNNENEEATIGELNRVYANLGLCGGNFGDHTDIFRFPMVAGRRYTVVTRQETRFGMVDTVLYDLDGRPILTEALERHASLRQFVAAEDGTFFVAISTTAGALHYWFLVTDQEPSECLDGRDNDEDGEIDTNDPSCTDWMDNDESDDQRASCNDGIDNDRDGRRDIFGDTSCRFRGADTEATVNNGCNLNVLNLFTGHSSWEILTQNRENTRMASCGANAGSPDRALVFHIDEPSTLYAETSDTTFDTVLHLSRGCGQDLEEIVCDDDGGTERTTSRLEIDLQPGAYTLFVDGFSENAMGRTHLTVNLTPTP